MSNEKNQDREKDKNDETNKEKENGDQKQRKEDKKEKRERKEKKEKKDKKSKKIKKDKKTKKDKKKKSSRNLSDKFGKYGLISGQDQNMKREEFIVWLREVKQINIESISHVQEKKLFDDYAEDYNTSTLPSKKYYDIRKWELKQLQKGTPSVTPQDPSRINDEAEKNKEFMDKGKRFQLNKTYQALQALYDTDLHSEMKQQETMRNQMINAYKMGNIAEADKIKKALTPAVDGQKKPNYRMLEEEETF